MNTLKLLLIGLLFTSVVQAQEHSEEAAKGPHGGKLLQDKGFALELVIYETGVPPEMRIYAFQDGQPLKPSQVKLNVSLDRLGGRQDQIQFLTEQDYLLGDQVITEPHSYDVTVKAQFQSVAYQWQFASHEGRTQISARQLQAAGVKTEIATGQTLIFTDTLFGVIEAPQDGIYAAFAPYPSMVVQVLVNVGDQVSKGQVVARLRNIQTLQTYTVAAPAKGEVSERWVNAGQRVEGQALVQITNLEKVWVQMSAFPESIEKLSLGQKVSLYDLHDHDKAEGQLSYISPMMTGGHIARARAVVANPEGHWRPGMHIKADIQVAQTPVALAVKASAIQSFRGMSVVFAKYGEQFEVRMVELGKSDGDHIEVLAGLEPGTEYVIENSFLIKADVLKDGASHDH